MLPAGRPPGTVSPWPGHQLACVRAHANTDTDEELTMTQLSSKIEPPPTPPLPGPAVAARTALLASTQQAAGVV